MPRGPIGIASQYRKTRMERYQTVGHRFVAGIIDGLVFIPLGLIDAWIFGGSSSKVVLLLWILITYPAGWAYSVIMHGLYGQTLGKMAVGIKVVDAQTEGPIRMRQAFFRDVVFVVFNTILMGYAIYFAINDSPRDGTEILYVENTVVIGMYVWFFAEILSCLTNSKCRALHDYIAGTVVIKHLLAEQNAATTVADDGPR